MTDKSRRIIHIDMDAFFASIEQRDNESLRGKPIIVGRNPGTRGVVATCSYEARVFGIRSAMPSKTAYQLCPSAVFVQPRYDVYHEVSDQIQDIFYRYTNLVEPLSLDEAFLDVSESINTISEAVKLACSIKDDILREVNLVSSAGVSYNKFIAKIASDYRKPNGLTFIEEKEGQDFLDQLPIEKFYGVGKKTGEKLTNLGIKNGRDLRMLTLEQLTSMFKKRGHMLYQFSHGMDLRPVEPNRIRKSISREMTFEKDMDVNTVEITKEMTGISQYLSDKLKENNKCGSTVTIILKSESFSQITRSYSVQYPVYKQEDILDISRMLLDKEEYTDKIRLIGIRVTNLVDRVEKYENLSLFDGFLDK